jgi:D-amino-acid dehydrogenase
MRRGICDVVVIGGGIVGLSVALELQSRGCTVVVIDHDRPQERASFGNAGVINAGSILTPAGPGTWRHLLRFATNRDPAVRIRYATLPHVARWLAHFLANCNETAWRRSAKTLNSLTAVAYDHHRRLASLADATALLRRDGYLKLFREPPADRRSILERQILKSAGVRALLLDAASLRDLEPFLAPGFTHALYFPESGSVRNPGRLVDLYWKAFRARGGGVRKGEAKAIEFGEDMLAVAVEGEQVNAARVVVAAGAGSPRLIAPLGYRIPFAAERGYHVQCELQPGSTLNRPLFDAAGRYAAAPMEDGVRVVTGIEIAQPDDPPDPRQLRSVVSAARASLPLADVVPNSQWMGSRPSTGDGLPVIGTTARHKRLLLAFGHGHIGFSTGPVTGEIIADLVAGKAPQIPIAPFSVERFG